MFTFNIMLLMLLLVDANLVLSLVLPFLFLLLIWTSLNQKFNPFNSMLIVLLYSSLDKLLLIHIMRQYTLCHLRVKLDKVVCLGKRVLRWMPLFMINIKKIFFVVSSLHSHWFDFQGKPGYKGEKVCDLD